ncbi:MAG: rhomboid family intramembrane serine protease [Saprospiraceae bacterium]|nr:rhomboid family intramembrane serine protease [Saprospiraceae bacterium]
MVSMFESDKQSLEYTRRHFYQSLMFPMLLIGALWLVHILQWLGNWDPGYYGIMSRRVWGLRGIFTAPMVHGSWGHLLSNTFPLFVLTALSAYFYRKVARRAFWMIYILTGLSVWAFARPVSHIGASGVVYGLVAFIFWNGIFRRSMRSIILAGMVVLLYSGMFFGILPDQEGISWESHLLGSLVGIFTSFWFKGELEDEEDERPDPFAEERSQEKMYFIPRDTFDKTKAQRIAEAEEEARRRAEQGPPSWPFWNQNQTW